MNNVATPATIKIPRVVVFLHRRKDGTIWTTGQQFGIDVKQYNTGVLRSRHVRSLDTAKQLINARLEPFVKEVVFVDPPGEAPARVMGRE